MTRTQGPGIEMLEAALAYGKRGWSVFPCRRDKKPATKNGVLDATTDLAQITKWWTHNPTANIGLDVGGAGMLVLDLDPGHSMKELENNVGLLPDTQLSTRTPRGGRHLFFALNDGEHVSASTSKLANHVDVRSFHSYVLLPPSQTEDGMYSWLATKKPAFRTDELFRVAASAKEKHEDRDTWIAPPDLSENIERAIRWLQDKAQVAIQTQGGDLCAYKTAGHCQRKIA